MMGMNWVYATDVQHVSLGGVQLCSEDEGPLCMGCDLACEFVTHGWGPGLSRNPWTKPSPRHNVTVFIAQIFWVFDILQRQCQLQ